jgi:hypothetical protein
MLRRVHLALFVVLSLADFVLTWVLIEHKDPGIVEGNPVARWYLTALGWPGLFAYKAATVVTAILILGLVARHRPRLAGHVLTLACAALTATVLYSGLLTVLRPASDDDLADVTFAADPEHVAYKQLMIGLQEDLLSGRRSLRDAAQMLQDSPWARNPEFTHARRLAFPGRSEDECFGAMLVVNTVANLYETDPQTKPAAEQLLRQFQATYDSAAPWSEAQLLARTKQDFRPDSRLTRGPHRPRWRPF